MFAAGPMMELRALGLTPGGPRTVVDHYPATREGLRRMAEDACKYSPRAEGVYFVVNPVRDDLLTPAKDVDVLKRAWLYVDVDPIRPVGPATDAEKQSAWIVAQSLRDALSARGWPAPIVVDSGNGYHLYYRVDLPAEDGGLVARVLARLAAEFDTPDAKVDTVVANASRVAKVPGTLARKGEESPGRPYRASYVLEAYGSMEVVPEALLRDLGGEEPAPAPEPAEAAPKRPTGTRVPGAPTGPLTVEQRAALYLAKVDPAVSGEGGHKTAFRAAMVGPAFDLPQDVAARLFEELYNPRCVPPWSPREVAHKVAEAYKVEQRRGWLLEASRPTSAPSPAPAPEPTEPAPVASSPAQLAAATPPAPEPLDAVLARKMRTDMGNGERFVARHGRDVRYCKPWGDWLVWDGRRYALDETNAVHRLAKDTARRILVEAATIADDDERKRHVEHAVNTQGKSRIDAMTAMAATEPGIPILPGEMNQCGWLLNCLNGTVDLRTGELRPHDRADLLTQLCEVEFDPDAKCPQWEATLDLFFAGDKALIAYWQRICGYALVGLVRDHVMPVAYGDGSNGKSTILGTVQDVLGPSYAMKAPPAMLMAKTHDSHPTDRADLYGKRLVIAIETEAGRRLDETMVKELTGGDRIRARRMRENFWEFSPSHTIIMATNHKPVVKGTDNGVWRRLRLIPFAVKVEGETADTSMPEKLRAEFPGILAWCVRGCLAWQEVGLNEPAVVKQATAAYRSEQDVVGLFLDERAILSPGLRTRCNAFFEAYKSWAEAAGERPMTMRAFGQAMKERGIEVKTSNGKWYLGVGLKVVDSSPYGRDEEWADSEAALVAYR